jgi:WhiB family redox-sensing transcriptional regulator
MSVVVDTWVEQAACRSRRGAKVDFYAEAGSPDFELARAICTQCSMRQRCLEEALTRGERYGVWGGLGPKERSRLTSTYQPG